jgi:hypothetical protein
MKAYFSGALYQKDKLDDKYQRIVNTLSSEGFEVLEDTTKVSLEEALRKSDDEREDYYKKVVKWIDRCDVAVVEASFPSTLSIGHEITLAVGKNKPVVVMYLEGRDPSFLLGLKGDKIIWTKYNQENLEKVLAEALARAKDQSDVRFNFFVSPKILNYLDWVAKKRMIPRSVFLRDLIEKEMKKDKDFKAGA